MQGNSKEGTGDGFCSALSSRIMITCSRAVDTRGTSPLHQRIRIIRERLEEDSQLNKDTHSCSNSNTCTEIFS